MPKAGRPKSPLSLTEDERDALLTVARHGQLVIMCV
jgi:hypothetical protein